MRNTIEADEEMLYSDKEIHFDESLTIEGRAVFENCKIYCWENGNESSMEIEEDGELEFINCEIIFCDVGASKRKNYGFCFITSDNGSMKINDCKLYNLYHFAEGSYQELEVTNSEFTNCMAEIFDTDTDYDGTISECRFISRNDNDDEEEACTNKKAAVKKTVVKKAAGKIIDPLIRGYFNISDCTFEFGANTDLYALELEDISSVSNCTFVNDEQVPAELLQDYTTCIHCKIV